MKKMTAIRSLVSAQFKGVLKMNKSKYTVNKNKMNDRYKGRIELSTALGCEVEGEGTISAVVDDKYCIQNADILGNIVNHLRVKVKGRFKWKGEKVKFKGKVYLYANDRKVGLKEVKFI